MTTVTRCYDNINNTCSLYIILFPPPYYRLKGVGGGQGRGLAHFYEELINEGVWYRDKIRAPLLQSVMAYPTNALPCTSPLHKVNFPSVTKCQAIET